MAVTFSSQSDVGSRARAHYLVLRKSSFRCRPRLRKLSSTSTFKTCLVLNEGGDDDETFNTKNN